MEKLETAKAGQVEVGNPSLDGKVHFSPPENPLVILKWYQPTNKLLLRNNFVWNTVLCPICKYNTDRQYHLCLHNPHKSICLDRYHLQSLHVNVSAFRFGNSMLMFVLTFKLANKMLMFVARQKKVNLRFFLRAAVLHYFCITSMHHSIQIQIQIQMFCSETSSPSMFIVSELMTS